MTERQTILTGGMAVLAYTAKAERAGPAQYLAHCISTYVREPDGWRMISHQQTL